MPHLILILFVFTLGACVGSFLNVVVWRLPRGQSLISPPSHCPKCQHKLAWYDNIPVFGWIFLGGRCRYCREPISLRYPIIEFITGALFVFYYVMFFILHISPCAPQAQVLGTDPLFGHTITANQLMTTFADHWPMYLLYMFMIAALLAISLIDAELFIIPPSIPWIMAGVGMLGHALIDKPTLPGALSLGETGLGGAMAIGGGIGLAISIILLRLGKLPVSFAEGEPALEIDEELYQAEVEKAQRENREPPQRPRQYTRQEIRSEIRHEMTFLLPALVGAVLAALVVLYVPAVESKYRAMMQYYWVSGLLGSLLGALVGGLMVWLARILGTLGFGRVAMGLGDVDLMFGVGAIIGPGAVVVAFFIAPFAGLAVGLYRLLVRGKWELPYGPYLSLATAAIVLVYCPIADYFAPGLAGLGMMIRGMLGGG